MFNFNFAKYKYVSISLSVLFILVGYGITFGKYKGFAHSLDFNGGLRAVVHFEKTTTRADLEKFFSEKEIEAVIILLDKEKNNFQIDAGLGSTLKIKEFYKANKIPNEASNAKNTVLIDEFIFMIKKGFNLEQDKILSADQVGAVVGGELTSTGFTLLASTLIIMAMYLSFRFQFKYAIAASVALIHDLLFAIAFIGAMQIKPSVPIIAALLTLFGYSINDTIVIFDRIRENDDPKIKTSSSQLINNSINQTLGRTINTSFSTLISIVALIIGGAVELFDFAFVLTVGIIVGTYSSIFIAAPILELYDRYILKKV